MKSPSTPKYLEEEESLTPECKELISTLPKGRGWVLTHLYHYQNLWHSPRFLQGMLSCQKHFQGQISDVHLVSTPKSGTTWLKAIIFTLLNRHTHHPDTNNISHPLFTQNPHQLVPFLEIDLYSDNNIPDMIPSSHRRLFSSHLPYFSLPESAKACKIVYLCRNPKDTLVSLWHFANKIRASELGSLMMEDAAERFCSGVSLYGPYWDHVLEYWNLSKGNTNRVLFLKYEEMRENPELHVGRLAEFLDFPFTAEEEESRMVEKILKFCGFDHLKNLQVNKNDKLPNGIRNVSFFRRGEVGDWKNHLTTEMVRKIDQITREKFHGSGLEYL